MLWASGFPAYYVNSVSARTEPAALAKESMAVDCSILRNIAAA